MWLLTAQNNRDFFEKAFPYLVDHRAPKSETLSFRLSDLRSNGNHLDCTSSTAFTSLKSIRGTLCSHPMKTLIRNDTANFLVKFSGQVVDRSLGLAT
uniref:Uncharacterized protein n=1 Tax=Paramoeba aestuarina TaxID=180227 RepID=A0A7S4NGI3_9EUKA